MSNGICKDGNPTCAGDGIAHCEGCNGYGVLRLSGKKFTKRGKGKFITKNSPDHAECNGTGLRKCGCVKRLKKAELDVLSGKALAQVGTDAA